MGINRAVSLMVWGVIASSVCLCASSPAVADKARTNTIEYEVHQFIESPFAIHGNAPSLDKPTEVKEFAETGAVWGRAWTGCPGEARGAGSEEEGYNWKRLDDQVRALTDAGANTMPCIMIGRTKAFPEELRERYRNWLRAAVERYDGDGIDDMPGLTKSVHYWQIENEWTWRWTGTPDELVELYRVSSETIHAADPRGKVVLGGLTAIDGRALVDGYLGDDVIIFEGAAFDAAAANAYPGGKRVYALIDAMLDRGYPYFDVLSFHKYGDYEHIPGCVAWLEDKMAANKYSRPIISTETGGPFIKRYEAYTEQVHADAVVKYHAVSLACGIKQIFWSTLYVLPEWGVAYANTSLVNQEGRKMPAFYTYQLLVKKLAGLKSVVRIPVEKWDTGTRIYKFETGSGVVYIMWSERLGGRHIEFPIESKRVRQTDVAGHETNLPVTDGKVTLDLTTSPVFVELSTDCADYTDNEDGIRETAYDIRGKPT